MLLDLSVDGSCEMSVRLNAVDFSGRGVEAMDLVPRPRTKLEDDAAGGAYERGDYGRVFESNETGRWDGLGDE